MILSGQRPVLFGAAPLQGVDAHAPLRTSGPARLPSASTEGIASPGVNRNLLFRVRFARIVPLLRGLGSATVHLRLKTVEIAPVHNHLALLAEIRRMLLGMAGFLLWVWGGFS